jgi:hypothetical protein
MRAIKVTYRAVFQQPIGPELNPMGLKLPGTFPVEIFSRGESNWLVREIASAYRREYKRLGKFVSLDAAKFGVRQVFEKQSQDWQIWGIPPMGATLTARLGEALNPLPKPMERLLAPYEIADLGNGKWAWIDPEDRTHILHGPLIDPKAKVPNAACGASVNAKCFISTKANVEPSCRECAEVWKREYRNKC